MPSSLVSNLYDDFTSTYNDDPQFIIDFFNKNTIVFNNLKTLADEDDLRCYIELSMSHAYALFQKNRYTETIDSINKTLPIIDKEIIKLNANESRDGYYTLFFLKGQASYRLNDYKTATPIFKELIVYDPKNENYKKWLRDSINKKEVRIFTMITIGSSMLILIETMLSFFKIGSLSFRNTLLITALSGLIGGFIYNLYNERSFRKSK